MSNNGFVRLIGGVVGIAVTCLAGGSVATASAGPETVDTFAGGGEIPDSDDLFFVDGQLGAVVDTLDGELAAAPIVLTDEALVSAPIVLTDEALLVAG